MKIRRATQSDLQDIAAIHVESWKDSYSDVMPAEFMAGQIDRDLARHWSEIEIQNEDIALVAEEDSLIGFVAVWCRPIPFKDNLHVRPSHNMRGSIDVCSPSNRIQADTKKAGRFFGIERRASAGFLCSLSCIICNKYLRNTRYELFDPSIIAPAWLTEWMEVHKITLWGAADLRDFSTPRDETGQRFPFALSWAVPMNPQIMVSIQNGPNQAYADEYARVNLHINELSVVLAAEIKARGFRSKPLAASDRTDKINIKGDFPHKTAATRAGLGWVGRHCQLITRQFGSWIRLGTVFSDIELPCGPPIERNFCGRCTRCVEACPAKALKGNAWYPGLPREEILDALACDRWKKEHYFQYHKGHNCGICSAVCPYGIKRGT